MELEQVAQELDDLEQLASARDALDRVLAGHISIDEGTRWAASRLANVACSLILQGRWRR